MTKRKPLPKHSRTEAFSKKALRNLCPSPPWQRLLGVSFVLPRLPPLPSDGGALVLSYPTPRSEHESSLGEHMPSSRLS